MTDAPELDLPARSHNNPPEILPVLPPDEPDAKKVDASLAEARSGLAEDEAPAHDLDIWAALSANTERFCDAAGEWNRIRQIDTAAQSERLTDFVTGARALYKKVETARKEQKAPWDAGATKVQNAYTPLLTKLERVATSMKKMQGDWLKREEDRIAAEKRAAEAEAARKREEAERLAAQAEARGDISAMVDAEAALKEAEDEAKRASRATKARAGSATGGGRAMALRTQRSAKIVNQRVCTLWFMNDPGVQEAVQRAASAAARGGAMTEDEARLAGFEIITSSVAA